MLVLSFFVAAYPTCFTTTATYIIIVAAIGAVISIFATGLRIGVRRDSMAAAVASSVIVSAAIGRHVWVCENGGGILWVGLLWIAYAAANKHDAYHDDYRANVFYFHGFLLIAT